VVSQLPLGTNFDAFGVHAEDRPSKNPETDPSADRFSVSADYLRTMRIPGLRGRDFTRADRAGSLPVVLVNQALARRFWGNDAILGKRLKVGGIDGAWRTVVGVVGNVRHRGLDVPQSLQIYLPQEQFSADNDMTLVIWGNLTMALNNQYTAVVLMLKVLDMIYVNSPVPPASPTTGATGATGTTNSPTG